jgi:RHS repeat-associated protein
MTYSSSLNRLLSMTDPLNRTKTFTYNSTGNMLTAVDAAGFTTTYAYTTRGLTTSVTQPDPDGAGPLTAPVTGLAYDTLGRLITLTNPDASTQAFTYNAADQLLTQRDELGKLMTYAYDALGRITSFTNRVNALTRWFYDDMSRMTKQIDAMGYATDVEYNNRGWVSKIIYPDPDGAGLLVRAEDIRMYDEVGNLRSQGDARGNFQGAIPYTYDFDNRLKTVGSSVDVGLAEVYNYDNAGRLISIDRVPPPSGGVDPLGGITVNPPDRKEYRYDAMGRVNQYRVFQPNSGFNYFSSSSGFNLAGERTSQTDGRGNTQTFAYDARGLLIMQNSPDPDGSGSQYSMLVSYTYDNMSRLVRVNRSAERVTSYEYNARSWPTRITEPDPDRSGPLTSPVTTIGYDLRGDRISVADPLSRVTTYSYDDEQRPIRRVDPDPDGTGPLLAPTTSWAYNANDWLASFTNPASALTTFDYDALGRLLTQTSPDPDDAGPLASPVTRYGYNMRGLASVTDPMTRVTSFVRDNRGRTRSVTDTANSVTDLDYDFYDNLLTRTGPDPDGPGQLPRPVFRYTYDAVDRMTTETDPLNGVTRFGYDAASNLFSVTDPVNNITQFGYDSWNRRTLETNSLSRSRSYIYDTAGNLTRTVDRNGRIIQYVYDALDRPIEERWQQTGTVNPSLTVTTVRNGSITNEQQRVGWSTTTSSVTNMSGTFTLSHGTGMTTPLAWNANAATIQAALEALPSIGAGNVLVEVAASTTPSTFGRTITLNFRNGKGGQDLPQTTISISSLVQTPINPRPSAFISTLVNGGTVSEEQQLSLRGASGGTWRVAYNGEVSAPLSPTITSFDLQNVLNNFLGIDNVVVVSGTLGGTDRVYNITFGGTQTGINMQPLFGDAANISNVSVRSITTTYNAASEVLSVNDPSSNVSFVRDNLGRATTVSSTINTSVSSTIVNNVGFSMGQSFDVVGNRTELRVSGSGTPDFRNIYSYDKLNRLTEVIQTNQAGGNQVLPKRVTMAYNALGQRTQIARFQSTGTANPVATTDFTYDSANRLSGIAHKQGSTNLNTYAYTYDPLSRVTSVNSTLEGLSSYTYWQNDQLVGVTNTGASNESYGYDANGNRNTTGFATTSDNRMTASPGFTYQYDHEGNMVFKRSTATGNYTQYTWDHRNRLTQVTERNNGHTRLSEINYEYDAFNRLVRRYDALAMLTPVTYWVYDEGINPLLEYYGGDPLIQHRYLWSDNVDELLADEQNPGLSSRNTLWALPDHLGSIRDIADMNESTGGTSIANHRRYDAFGRRVSETNAAVDLIFGYTGKLFDETTRLQNNLNRWYDSSTGRWISQDPIGFNAGDANLYRYVGNHPTYATDPSGLQEPISPPTLEEMERIRQQLGRNRAMGGIALGAHGNGRPAGSFAVTVDPNNRTVPGSEIMRELGIRKNRYVWGFPVETDDYWTLKQGCVGLNKLRLNTENEVFGLPGTRAFSSLEAALEAQREMMGANDRNTRIVISAYQDNYLDDQLVPFLLDGSGTEYDMNQPLRGGPPNTEKKGNLAVFDFITVHQNEDRSVCFYETMDFGQSANPNLNVQRKTKLYPPERAGTIYLVTPIPDHPRAPRSPFGTK